MKRVRAVTRTHVGFVRQRNSRLRAATLRVAGKKRNRPGAGNGRKGKEANAENQSKFPECSTYFSLPRRETSNTRGRGGGGGGGLCATALAFLKVDKSPTGRRGYWIVQPWDSIV